MSEHTWAVIMAGGVGSRFWPLSRRARPKQLVDLFGEGSMLRLTVDRLAPVVAPERQVIVTGSILGDAIAAELPEVPRHNILEEPCGRNTAPAIAWAARVIAERDPDAVLAILPADQFIADVEGYRATVQAAVAAARDHQRIITLGIRPTRPETGYGYIRAATEQLAPGVSEVAAFVEKPDLGTAISYLAAGDYLWNAGMFFVPARLILEEIDIYEPDLAAGIAALTPANMTTAWPELTSISIDYAVMERTSRVAVMPGDFGWSDVGSWRTLFDYKRPGDSSFSRGNVIEIDGSGNVLFAEGDGVVATVGVSDLIVVHTADATLVCPRDQAQRLRDVVGSLKENDMEDWL